MENPVIVFGANGIGRIAKDIFERNGNVVYGFLDDSKALHNTELDEVVILGATDDDGFLKLIGKKCEAFIATDDTKLKKHLTEMVNEVRHVQVVNAIHPDSSVGSQTIIGHGNLIDRGARLAPGVTVGSHCIIHANAVLGVGAVIGDYVQIGAGAIIGEGVNIQNESFIGAGVTVVANITIGEKARVGAGSVVVSAVKNNETVFGNPAQKINT
jgi:sugar O-acyltransferase (sialic acid O-acetyltransferase NeuD family)